MLDVSTLGATSTLFREARRAATRPGCGHVNLRSKSQKEAAIAAG
jgi:hypothetical protein